MKRIVIFASGYGSNTENIIKYFKSNYKISVVAVFTNNSKAKVLEKSNSYQIHTEIFNKVELLDSTVLDKLNKIKPDLIVLAGFLLKFPEIIIKEYTNKIINIHPSLLPKYGGKGMYGMNVHKEVFKNKETKTGITIHHVNSNYDDGKFIFQKNISILNCKTPEEIAKRVQYLEMKYFPKEIERLMSSTEM